MADAQQPSVSPGGGLPLSPALADELHAEFPASRARTLDRRVWFVSALAVVIGVLGVAAAQALLALINFCTNLAFFHRLSLERVSPAESHLGWTLFVVPIVGGLIVGLMARFGAKGIRGHGIPEAMEQVLTNQSRIPARILFLKPLSAAVSIGTGGPFGAEGPIIATGGALGSLVGQIVSTTAAERKALLAAGAAAGMTAMFGTPVAAVLLAIELLLFEYRPQSLIPVAVAAVVAAAGHIALAGPGPVFPMPAVDEPGLAALATFLVQGVLFGVLAVGVTRIIYFVEDAFERLPVHWMWWPALGGVAIGVIGFFAPRTLGVGYENLDELLNGSFTLRAAAFLGTMKFISWTVSLGSGTSGGTLAPLLTIGGCLGAALALAVGAVAPTMGFDPRIAALVGMAALFGGASRAPLASVLFAAEATHQPNTLLPLLCGCAMSYLVSCRLMRNSIMTEKIARRGIAPPTEYIPDPLDQVLVRTAASKEPVVLRSLETVATARAWLLSGSPGCDHQGFPVVDDAGVVQGVITRRELLNGADLQANLRSILRRTPIVVYDDSSVRDAAEHMVRHDVGRLPVLARGKPPKLIGMLTRSDILAVYSRRLKEFERAKRAVS
jgi:H+/Cl- antiporter ClcA